MKGKNILLVFPTQEGEKKIPLKMGKSVRNGYGLDSSMICPDCYGEVKQFYKCENCNKLYRKGELYLRKDKETGTVYNDEEKKAYLKEKSTKDVKILFEVSVDDLIEGIELFDGNYYELYNGDQNVVMKIYALLKNKRTAFFVEYESYGSKKHGIILPTDKKLLLCQFRDSSLIRKPEMDLSDEENEVVKKIAEKCISCIPEKYLEFLSAVQSGTLETKIKEKKIEETEKDLSFLDNLEIKVV